MKSIYVFLSVFLFGFCHKSIAQPFDTLLLDFYSIHEIYPLDDGTFILIGQKDKIVVQRINHKAEPLWTTYLGRDAEDEIRYVRVHLHPGDSSIQVRTVRRNCDYHEIGDCFVYTLSFLGEKQDSAYIPPLDNPINISFLSGRPDFPRFSRSIEDNVILFYDGGDTVMIRPNQNPEIDDIIGVPRKVAMTPQGDLLIFTTGGFIFRYRLENGSYSLIDRVWAFLFNYSEVYCVDEEYFVVASTDKLKLIDSAGYLQKQIGFENGFISNMRWRPPYFTFIINTLDGTDSVYVVDQFLNEVYKEQKTNDDHFSAFAIHNKTTFKVGSGYPYLEGGTLLSWHQETKVGPEYYDIKFIDFEIPDYDRYEITGPKSNPVYVYHYPGIKITLQNNGDYTISNITLQLINRDSYCPYTAHWERQITNMNLAPGATETYLIPDVVIPKRYPYHYPLFPCLIVNRQDNHPDDYPFDNDICKEIEFTGKTAFPDSRLQYFPNPAHERLFLANPDGYTFDVHVYDPKGAEILALSALSNEYPVLDISSWPEGLYFIEFVFTDGHTEAGKFLKYN